MIGIEHYIVVSSILFGLGVLGIVLNRKNIIIVLMAIELILLSVNINLVAFSAFLHDLAGQIFAMFVLTWPRVKQPWAGHPRDLLPQPRYDCGGRRQPDEGVRPVHSILFIVFLPLLASAIAGLGNKALGKFPAKVVTTGGLLPAPCRGRSSSAS
jgi:NADH:ubiquinone oxidoreductase subunit K